MVQMLRGRPPALPHALSGFMLALTAFAPLYFYSYARGEDVLCGRGPGFWLWLSSFAVTAAAALWEYWHWRPLSAH
jgi:hypothetical protein